MTALVWANFPLMLLFVLAIVGIPMWMIFRRPDRAPDHSQAHAYLRAKADAERGADASAPAPAQVTTMAAAATLPSPRQGRWQTTGPRGIGPGRRHSGGRRGARAPGRDTAGARPGRAGREA